MHISSSECLGICSIPGPSDFLCLVYLFIEMEEPVKYRRDPLLVRYIFCLPNVITELSYVGLESIFHKFG